MAATVDLWVEQGTSWGMAFPIIDANGDAVDLAGWSARAQIRSRAGASGDPLFEWGTDDEAPGRLTLADGVLTMFVTPEQSTSWSFSRGVFDVELVSPSGEVARPISGTVYVSPEVTR